MGKLNTLSKSLIFPLGEKLPEQFCKYSLASHISIETNVTVCRPGWLKPVTDEVYNRL